MTGQPGAKKEKTPPVTSGYVIRTIGREEMESIVDWAALEGWNPGLHDADCFYAADPEGFFMGFLDGEPVASISAVRYDDSFGFLGFYIVRPEYRGRGLGIQIWNAGLAHLDGCNVGLDGVMAQQENYRKSGFRPAYRNIRYEGVSGGHYPDQGDTVNLLSVPFETVGAYDASLFPVKRTNFLGCWLNQPESSSFGVLQDRRLSGYGTIRTCRKGYKMGPLFADNPESADLLFCALKASVEPGLPVYLDIPETNPDAVSLAGRHGMKVVFETARMYTRTNPDIPLERLFGVTTFELG